MEGLEKNLAHALTNYLELTEQERRECREIVRLNAAEHLSWDNLAERLTEIAGAGQVCAWRGRNLHLLQTMGRARRVRLPLYEC
jgi:hypothetical protein